MSVKNPAEARGLCSRGIEVTSIETGSDMIQGAITELYQ